jgi:hemolysin D
VLSVSRDAIVRDISPDKTKDNEPKGQELGYAARISLDRAQIQIEDTLASLSPGMAATAEVKTGSRRFISYLLSPILKYKQDALRER